VYKSLFEEEKLKAANDPTIGTGEEGGEVVSIKVAHWGPQDRLNGVYWLAKMGFPKWWWFWWLKWKHSWIILVLLEHWWMEIASFLGFQFLEIKLGGDWLGKGFLKTLALVLAEEETWTIKINGSENK
jgi:hypothetical protein